MWSQSPSTKNSKYGAMMGLSNSFAVSRCNWTKYKAHYLGHIVSGICRKYQNISVDTYLSHWNFLELWESSVYMSKFFQEEQILCVCLFLGDRLLTAQAREVECEIYLHVKPCDQNTWIKSSFMLVLAHMQVFCICIFLPVLPTGLQKISVGGTGAPRCPF